MFAPVLEIVSVSKCSIEQCTCFISLERWEKGCPVCYGMRKKPDRKVTRSSCNSLLLIWTLSVCFTKGFSIILLVLELLVYVYLYILGPSVFYFHCNQKLTFL